MFNVKRKGILSLVIAFIMILSVFSGCGTDYKFNRDYFFGLCDPSGSLEGGVDKAITNEWLGDVVDVLGVKSFRLWVNLEGKDGGGLFSVDKNNDLSFNQGYLAKVHDYVNNLKRGGVKNFLFLNTTYLHPYGSPMKGYDVPDVYDDEQDYLAFLEINAKAYGMLAAEFPEIKNWEVGNEPDLNGGGMHKFGYNASDLIASEPYMFSDKEIAEIVCDLCWYIRRELKKVSSEHRVALPGRSLAYDYNHSFFESIYEVIESKTLPYGTEYSDIDPDNYFDIIDWHPYMNMDKFGSPYYLDFPEDMWEEWAENTIEVHNIAAKHGDAEKPAYFSEFGYTDVGEPYNGELQNQIAKNYVIALDIIKERMPWVETVFCFRATTLVHQKASDNKTEENFGIFYNKDDPENGGRAKPAAIALADYFGNSGSEHFANFDWLYNKYSK